jgi:hypothetical protein
MKIRRCSFVPIPGSPAECSIFSPGSDECADSIIEGISKLSIFITLVFNYSNHNMTSCRITGLLLLTLALISGCGKGPKCWGEDEDAGIVINTITPTCEGPAKLEAVINSAGQFDTLFGKGCTLPPVNFVTETLLIKHLTASGCENKMRSEVTPETTTSQYKFKVTIKECGNCKKLGLFTSWVTVPKLQPGWTVEFSEEID